jgi:hypothetical protein
MALPTMPLVARDIQTSSYTDLAQLGQNRQRLGLAQQGMEIDRQNLLMRQQEHMLDRMSKLDELQRKQLKDTTAYVGRGAAWLKGIPALQRGAAIPQLRQDAQTRGMDLSGVSDQQLLDDRFLDLQIMQSRELEKMLETTKPPSGYREAGGGLEAIPGGPEDPEVAGRLAAAKHKEAAGPASIREYEYAKGQGYKGSYMDFTTATGKGELPSSVQEWQFFNGLSPEQQERFLTMKRANRPVDIGGSVVTPSMTQPGQVSGAIEKTLPPQDRPAAVAEREAAKVEGKREGELPQLRIKAESTMRDLEAQHAVVAEDIDRALSLADSWTTGFTGSAMSFVPGSDAYNLKAMLDGIKANIGFDKLQEMRANSPTGGALGQVSERENTLLQSVMGSLDQSQSKDQFRRNLERLKRVLRERQASRREAFDKDFGPAAPRVLHYDAQGNRIND